MSSEVIKGIKRGDIKAHYVSWAPIYMLTRTLSNFVEVMEAIEEGGIVYIEDKDRSGDAIIKRTSKGLFKRSRIEKWSLCSLDMLYIDCHRPNVQAYKVHEDISLRPHTFTMRLPRLPVGCKDCKLFVPVVTMNECPNTFRCAVIPSSETTDPMVDSRFVMCPFRPVEDKIECVTSFV